MSHETELKLSLPREQVNALEQHSFWKKHSKSMGIAYLGNTYYDTLDLRLNQADMALRIRVKNGQWIQSLKTRGESINGLTRRGEWEWPLESAILDYQKLQPCLPEILKDITCETLKPLFATDFHRTLWLIEWQQPQARIEAALDIGLVKVGKAQSPICELELELLEGDEQALLDVASILGQHFDLTPSNQSKAEAGFKLIATTLPSGNK